MKSGSAISIWFFIGLALAVDGVLIFGIGLYELFHPPHYRVTLYALHANIWWGGLLLLSGLIYCIHFSPANSAPRKRSG